MIQKELLIRFYCEDEQTLEKLEKLKNIFNEKAYSKTIKKIIDTYEIK